MKLLIIGVGKIRTGYLREGIEGYVTRIKRYHPLESLDIREEKQGGSHLLSSVLKKEGERILSKLEKSDFAIVLHDEGGQTTSRGFADSIEKLLSSGKKRICFIIGGAYGLHPSVIERADTVLSLSKMIFPHEMARLVLTEQIYRAFTIIKGEPYSH